MRKDIKYTAMSDEALVEVLRTGDMRAYEEIFSRYYPSLSKFASALLKDTHAAEDIVQNVFMKIWRGRGELAADQSLRNYLFVLTRNESLDVLKSKRVKNVTVMPQLPDLASEIQNGDTATDASLVMDGIALLPPQCQKVFRMSRFEHKTNKQIAEELNISVRTVDKHIELALKNLRKNFS